MVQQSRFPVRITSPDGGDLFLFEQLTCQDRLSEPYTLDLQVLSEKDDIQPKDVMGKPMTVLVQQAAGGDRQFHGLVSRFVLTGEHTFSGERGVRQLYRYQLRLQPWFWFLTKAADCRIFQKKTVPDIFEAVAKDHGFHD